MKQSFCFLIFSITILLQSCGPKGKIVDLNNLSGNPLTDGGIKNDDTNGNGSGSGNGSGPGTNNGATNGGTTGGSFPDEPGGKMGFNAPESSNCAKYQDQYDLNDPYFCQQWHISNRGQTVNHIPSTSIFSKTGKPGADINAYNALAKYSGKNVNIYITDDGLQSSHPDIAANFLGGKNNCTGGNDSLPPKITDIHGTMVSGIIAAVGNNGIGVSGISHNAKIFMNNIIGCQNGGASAFVAGINIPNTYQLWSGSWGMGTCQSGFVPRSQMSSQFDAFTQAAKNNNIVFFKANGNDNGCGSNGNADNLNAHFAVASIGAVDNEGNITSYSSKGSNLLVSNFAGYGGQSAASPGIVTIVRTNEYTADMNGTSAATPATTGVTGLVYEARPGLKWYDYQHALAQGATIINETQTATSGISGADNINYFINDAGYRHSFSYGFGVVDADATVSFILKNYTALPELKKFSDQFSSTPQSDITPESFAANACSEKTIDVTNDLQIFSTELSFDVKNAPVRDLAIFVTTPKGKVAQILRPSNLPGSNLIYDQYFKSMQFYGMSTKGLWKIKVCGKVGGSFNGAKINFYGFSGNPIKNRM